MAFTFNSWLLVIFYNMNRTEQLLALRPEITTDSERISLPKEAFQNNVLRPILKFQNEAVVGFFKAQIKGATLPDFKAELHDFVQQRLQKDMVTRNTLVGMVIGFLSEEELAVFLADKNEVSKRIVEMLSQRIANQLSQP